MKTLIEVFKTNVQQSEDARLLVVEIQKMHPVYKANFDLDDCDKILRVKSAVGLVNPQHITTLIRKHGFFAEVLPDEEPPGLNEPPELISVNYN